MDDIVYFELNNWACGRDYPDAEPFGTWMGDDENLYFENEEWVKENKLVVVFSLYDMSCNFCISAPRKWVEENCPELLTKYTQFLREPEDGEIVPTKCRCSHFEEYKEENIGITEDTSFWDSMEAYHKSKENNQEEE